MKYLLPFILFASLGARASEKPTPCLSTREFITALSYLREQRSFALPEKSMRERARRVTEGCTGSSKRFIDVTDLLVKAGSPSAKALELGERFALRSDREASAFQNIFRSAFVKELLDLSLPEAVKIATELSLEYDGDPSIAESEFEKVVRFCTGNSSLGLPLLACGDLATRVVRSGASHPFKVGEEFIALFRYLSEKNFVTADALKTSEKVLAHGPMASENFRRAYEYALEPKGLNLSRKEAAEFATGLAELSLEKPRTSK